MRNAKIFVLVGLAAALQLSFFGAMRPFGVIPNLAIILITWLSLVLSDGELVLASACLGIIFDLSSGVDFGLRATFYIMYCLVLLVVRQMGGDFEYWPASLIAIASGSIFYNIAVAASLMLAGESARPLYFGGLALREVGLDIVLAIVLRPLVVRLLSDSSGHVLRRA